MNTTIRIKNLRLKAIIGVDRGERTAPQDVIVNVSFELTDSRSAETDELTDTVDYRSLEQRIRGEAENTRFHLLEKLAAHILALVMADPKVRSASVEIDKRGVLERAESVSATCSATRGDNR